MKKTRIPFTSRATQAILTAQTEAQNRNNAGIAPEHILLGMIQQKSSFANRCLTMLKVPADYLPIEIERIIGRPGPQPSRFARLYDADTEKVLKTAEEEARLDLREAIGTAHILAAILKDPRRYLSRRLNEQWNVNYHRIKHVIHMHMPRRRRRKKPVRA